MYQLKNIELLQAFEQHIDQNLHFLKGKKLLVACSGGLDSIVLTHLLAELNQNIGIAHCNFSLRGVESDGDEAFVVDLAEKLSIPVFTEKFDTKLYAKTNKLSTQMAARELRYNWFEEIIKDFNYDYLLTAHHADDDLETFLINLSRGTGLRGLTGIPLRNDLVVRPMLSFERKEIMAYAKRHNLYWREDSSNKETDYLRNKLRIDVIPNYKEASKNLLQSFQKTQRHLTDSQNLIEDYMALVFNLAVTEVEDGFQIEIQKLQELPNTDALLFELLSPFGFTDFLAISELISAQSGKLIFSKTHRLIKDRNTLLLTENISENKIDEIFIDKSEKKIDHPISLSFKSIEKIGDIDTSVIYVDSDKLSYPLQLRKWLKGDTFQPFGMQGNKKLSKFFKDEKLSLVAKEKIWLLCSDKKIVWIIGIRQDDRFKVTSQTKNLIKIMRTP